MSIARDVLAKAFKTIAAAWNTWEESTEWDELAVIEQYGHTTLRITKSLDSKNNSEDTETSTNSESLDDDSDSDAEALPRHKPTTFMPRVIYDIIHSPSYQVPVLYFTFANMPSKGVPSPAQVYEYLVPGAFSAQVRDVGVVGAVSMTEHPVTGLPTFFVHPCRTQDAMRDVLTDLKADDEKYLVLWLGLVGGAVGLNVPTELALKQCIGS